VRARIEREFAGWQFVHQNVLELEAERSELLRTSRDVNYRAIIATGFHP
jgi:hypothetical protein